MLIFGNAERALVDLTHRLAAGEDIKDIRDLRGTAFMVPAGWLPGEDWGVHNSTRVDVPGKIDAHPDPVRHGPGRQENVLRHRNAAPPRREAGDQDHPHHEPRRAPGHGQGKARQDRGAPALLRNVSSTIR
jgi:radical SAM superfamily enzyme YgiQ (UPF0313 family)